MAARLTVESVIRAQFCQPSMACSTFWARSAMNPADIRKTGFIASAARALSTLAFPLLTGVGLAGVAFVLSMAALILGATQSLHHHLGWIKAYLDACIPLTTTSDRYANFYRHF